MRDRLIDILMEWFWKDDYGRIINYYTVDEAEKVADYLLANGVIVPPCKMGDTVYCVDNSPRYAPILECEVVEIGIDKNGPYIVVEIKINRGLRRGYSLKQIGKTVFLTKEEAEQALKERGKE